MDNTLIKIFQIMRKTPTNKIEAMELIAKRQHNKEAGSEDQLQVACVNAFASRYPEKRGRLFATFQNPTDKTQTNIWIAKGLVAGVSDLIYIDDDFHICGLELKQKGKRHSVEHLHRQIRWMKNNCHRAGFVTSISEFWDMIENRNDEIFRKKIELIETFCGKTFQF
jgi:hypothetical protein